VIADEIEHQAYVAVTEALAEALERGRSPEVAMHDVLANRKRRAAHVGRPEIDERLTVLGLPLRPAPRYRAPGIARLPHAEEPHPLEAVGGDAVEVGVRDVVEARRSAERLTDLVEARASIDLIERRESAQRVSTAFPNTSSIDSALIVPNRCMRGATSPVQPVWWLAPIPAPLSPWKYS
jgi:hypothetical protein